MKLKSYILIIAFVCLAPNINAIRNILILGDSHFLGSFGEYVHSNLHYTNRYDIMSIAIGGAGTRHYTMTMRNFCCGYKIRVSCADANQGDDSEVYLIEKSSTGNNTVVGKEWDGDLDKLINYWLPDIVVVSLGSNNTNAHQDLVDIVRRNRPDLPIVWIGPFLRLGSPQRYRLIENAVNRNENIHLVRSDDIIGNDTLASAHYYGYAAKKWANEVTDRMDLILNNIFEN